MQEPGKLIGGLSPFGQLIGELSAGAIISGKEYTGSYEVTAKANEEVEIPTSGKLLMDNIKVNRIPYYETSNPDGYTVIIG